MNREDVVAYLNEEIANLMRTRDWLQGSGSADGAQAGIPQSRVQAATTAGRGRIRKGISAAGRRKISEMMKARWAARRQQSGQVSSSNSQKPGRGKRNVSAAARARMAAAQRRRWAAFRKERAGK